MTLKGRGWAILGSELHSTETTTPPTRHARSSRLVEAPQRLRVRVMSEVAVAERFGERHRLSSLPFGYLIEVGQTTMTAGPLDLYV